VQSALLPSLPHSAAGVLLATEYRPAEQVGGDFFDAFPVNDGGLALVVGDVSGKGVPAALIVGVIHGAVRSSNWTGSADHHEEESASLNRLLCERASMERYASMCWCYYDPAARSLHYVNAGHWPPLLVRSEAGAPGSVTVLEGGGPVLGLLADVRYAQSQYAVCPGDVLVLFTDGVIEATNSTGEEFGVQRLHTLLAELGPTARDPKSVRAAILGSVESFLGSAKLQDDLTLVVAQFG
jgi:sigma-B regulation protein RsbU (phosphoserine phosphatase)